MKNFLIDNFGSIVQIVAFLLLGVKFIYDLKMGMKDIKNYVELKNAETKSEIKLMNQKFDMLSNTISGQNGRMEKIEKRLSKHLEGGMDD